VVVFGRGNAERVVVMLHDDLDQAEPIQRSRLDALDVVWIRGIVRAYQLAAEELVGAADRYETSSRQRS
jgi:hypothetical protein